MSQSGLLQSCEESEKGNSRRCYYRLREGLAEVSAEKITWSHLLIRGDFWRKSSRER
jgi:hypothetical protein